jgi:hypothetical protein
MTQITDLPQASTPLNPGDIVLVIQNGNAKQVAQSQIGDNSPITPAELPIATTALVGAVKPDGTTVTITPDGTITAHSSVTGATITGSPVSGELTKFSGSSTITNGDLSGDVTTSGSLATTVAKIQGTSITGTSGSGNVVLSSGATLANATLTTPDLGTPSNIVLTNATGTATGLTSGSTLSYPTFTGDIQNTGNATTVTEIQGTIVAGTSGTGNVLFQTSPTFITPALGTPSSGNLVNCSGVATNLTAGKLSDKSANTLAGFDGSGHYANVTIGAGLSLSGNTIQAAAAAPTFDLVQSGTNTTAAMVVGTGGSLGVTGSGTITATAAPASGITGTTLATNVVTSSLTTVGTIGTGTWHGTAVGVQYGGTGANLSATGGSNQVLQQTSSGGAITVGQLSSANLSDGTTGSGAIVLATNASLTTPNLGTPSAVVLTNASGTASSLTAGHATALANNTANTLAGFDNSGVYGDVTIGSGLSLSGGSLSASASAPAFTSITSGTNTTATMTVGTGGALTTSGSGTITATAVPASGVTGTTLASSVTASSLTSFGASIALGTPASGTLTNCTFPTLNQNTSGSAASLSVTGQTGLFTIVGLTSTNRAKTVRDAADTILELGGSYTPTGTWTSMALTNPTVTTQTVGDNSTKAASTAFVSQSLWGAVAYSALGAF